MPNNIPLKGRRFESLRPAVPWCSPLHVLPAWESSRSASRSKFYPENPPAPWPHRWDSKRCLIWKHQEAAPETPLKFRGIRHHTTWNWNKEPVAKSFSGHARRFELTHWGSFEQRPSLVFFTPSDTHSEVWIRVVGIIAGSWAYEYYFPKCRSKPCENCSNLMFRENYRINDTC